MLTHRSLLVALAAWASASAQISPGVFQGAEVEQYLSAARVKAIKDVGDGVTKPKKATLELNRVERFAIFKTIDVNGPGIVPAQLGGNAPDFQDTWKTEVAAYVVDRMIGLELVPATIERVIDKKTGSLQWWVDGTMTEAARQQMNRPAPPDAGAWERAELRMRLFDNLICNTDRNPSNMLVTTDFQLRLIDHSRAFRPVTTLRNPAQMTRFSRPLLEALPRLTAADLTDRAGKYLTGAQIAAVIARRDAIVAYANTLIAERGEAAVLYR